MAHKVHHSLIHQIDKEFIRPKKNKGAIINVIDRYTNCSHQISKPHEIFVLDKNSPLGKRLQSFYAENQAAINNNKSIRISPMEEEMKDKAALLSSLKQRASQVKLEINKFLEDSSEKRRYCGAVRDAKQSVAVKNKPAKRLKAV